MEQHKIDRINYLAQKRKQEGLTRAEEAERAALHREYLDAIRGSLQAHLDNTYVVDAQGHKTKLHRKEGR